MRCNVKPTSSMAFTLIELLASMAVLSVLVLAVGKIFNETTKAYQSAKRNVDINTEANAALKLMNKELSQAIFDKQTNNYLSLNTHRNKGAINYTDAVFFVTGAYDYTGDKFEKKYIGYTLVDNELRRYVRNLPSNNETNPTADTAYYSDKTWYLTSADGQQAITTNVFSFRIDYCTDPVNATYVSGDANTQDNNLSYLNIYFEILDSENMKIVSNLREIGTPGALQRAQEIAAANTKRYTKRIYFNNYDGYYKNDR